MQPSDSRICRCKSMVIVFLTQACQRLVQQGRRMRAMRRHAQPDLIVFVMALKDQCRRFVVIEKCLAKLVLRQVCRWIVWTEPLQ